MATTLTQLLPRVRHKLGLSSDDGMLTDASLTVTLNDAIAKMSVEYNWPWLVTEATFNTVAGQNEYTPPAGWIKSMWLKYNDQELGSRQRTDLIQWDASTGTPVAFAIWEQKIWLSPAPDQVYTITHSYMKTENALATGSDTVLCPDQFVDVIVTYAAIIEARRLHDSSLEDQLLTDKKEWLRNISKLVPQVDILPRQKVGRFWPSGH